MPTASEVGEFVFCRRAWGYRRRGAPQVDVPERREGLDWHRREAGRAARARHVQRAGTLLLALGAALALISSLHSILG